MPAELPVVLPRNEVVVSRSIGSDVHRDLCQVAIADGGRAADRHDA